MRGRSTSAKARLRSAGYKCNLCGRRVIDAITLERHQKTVHNISTRVNKESFKPKPAQTIKRKPSTKESIKEKEKINTKEKEDIVEQTRPKRISRNSNESQITRVKESVDEEMDRDQNIDLVKNGESISADTEDSSTKKDKNSLRQIHFICPACNIVFSVYYNAHKHIQKDHPNVPKIRPVRVEPCCRCNCQIRSDEAHKCRKLMDSNVCEMAEYICSGCNQIFISLKSFDMHVAGLHSDAVDSMFFPTKLEFVTWRLEMERETNAKYSLYGEYDSKKIFRCNYARNDKAHEKYTAYFCPSSMVVQEFSKGIQVHFYQKHYDHNADEYTLSSKYKKYSITKFLSSKNPAEASFVTSRAGSGRLSGKELFSRFKNLMDGIVSNASAVDTSVLENLIEKALEMSSLVTDVNNKELTSSLKSTKKMSDKEIAKELEVKMDVNKRRKSIDSSEISVKPAKRMRNKSLFNQSPSKLSPKIVNTFSLASSSNEEELASGNSDDVEIKTKDDNTDKLKVNQTKNVPESDKTANKTKVNTRLSGISESLSFNDSYKDFIDKNFIAKDVKLERPNKQKVKTKLGAFKQISPRRAETKEDTSNRLVVNRFIKPTPNESEIDQVSTKVDTETPKLNILSIETPNVKISKVSSGKTETTNAQITNLKVNLKSKHTVDPYKINITKVNRSDSVVEPESSALKDPLELSITKPKIRNITTSPKNNAKVLSRKSSSIDPLTPNTTKVNITPKVYSGPKTPKVSPKVTFEDPSPQNTKVVLKKVPDIKYEVVEQENDCNILVLKF